MFQISDLSCDQHHVRVPVAPHPVHTVLHLDFFTVVTIYPYFYLIFITIAFNNRRILRRSNDVIN